mmetsp:Transcript_17391/g.36465  ORF Transcript_17391/g.36465 Transcript_17391/m.36465 type:complete len:135 (+) Transcript_17391:3108-3512(+)
MAAAPPQHQYNPRPCHARNYSHCYGDDEHVDEASFFQAAQIPGVDDNVTQVIAPDAVDTNLLAHRIMLIIASKVIAGETHISLKQGLKVFVVDGENVMFKELDVLHLQKVFAPQSPDGLTKAERWKALELLMFL